MLKFSRWPLGLLALAIAAPVMAQPATSTMPSTNSPPVTTAPSSSKSTAAAPKADIVDINSATAAELKMLPGVNDSDATKIVQGRPRPWKNSFAEDGGPTSAVRLRQGLRADPGTQARIACSSGPIPM